MSNTDDVLARLTAAREQGDWNDYWSVVGRTGICDHDVPIADCAGCRVKALNRHIDAAIPLVARGTAPDAEGEQWIRGAGSALRWDE